MAAFWRVQSQDVPRASALAAELGIEPLTAQLLLNRGVSTHAAAVKFLSPSLDRLDDPGALPDMERAIDRLRRAITQQEPIAIFGDSDVDGLTASVILYEVLHRLGARLSARQSNRLADGYGVPASFIQQACGSSTKLAIFVDCGTNQPDAVRALSQCGIDTIIIDHHVPLDGWAEPVALINPHRSHGQGRELCSAGIAFKVVQALVDSQAQDPRHADLTDALVASLDLAALGTLADCAPLIGESRLIVSQGLAHIVRSRRRGLQRLCESTNTREPEPEQVLRRLVPRLNASGRLGDPAAVWTLLLSAGDGALDEPFAENAAAHATTKQLHRQILSEAHEQVNRLHFRDQYVMVISRNGWHQGIMGSLAAQLAQQYGRPAIAIAVNEHHGIGSGRSFSGFNLLEALQGCQELLVRFGGHAQACGLTVDRAQLEPFRARINHHARQLIGNEGLVATRTIDAELSLEAVTVRWAEEVGRLAPFGIGNPRPTVVIRRLRLDVRSPRIGVLSDGAREVAARGPFAELTSGGWYDVVATPVMCGGVLTLTVSDVKDAAAPSTPGRISGTPCTSELA